MTDEQEEEKTDSSTERSIFQSVHGGGASMTNFIFNCSARFERVIVYLCLTAIALCWIAYR